MTEVNQPSWRDRQADLEANGLYDRRDEKDACGVGLVAAIDGKASRKVVDAAIQALKSVWHRGAVGADGKTGDGAGIRLAVPQEFFRKHIARTGHVSKPDTEVAVGMIFLPRTDLDAKERCRVVVEREILNFGYKIFGWRQVPVEESVLGEKADEARPEIEQIMIEKSAGVSAQQMERDLYLIRRRIEKTVRSYSIPDFYICSLSLMSVIYKGMFLAEDIDVFFPDLQDRDFESHFAVYHQRYSTNTFPTWWLAQPFRVLAHNGEINTIQGNENWMKAHESRMTSDFFSAEQLSDIRPVVQPGSSDSASLDAAVELMSINGRNLPMVKTLMIPEAWEARKIKADHRDLYAYCGAVMEPWDGPAAICAVAGDWAVAGMDRNGLRPLRYSLTDDNLLIAGSETGMVPVDEPSIIEKGRLAPGEMIAVDFAGQRLLKDQEIKDELAASQDFSGWGKNIKVLDDLLAPAKRGGTMVNEGNDLRRRQIAAGVTLEELELILHPMGETGKEAVGSMGDDAPLAVLSEEQRGIHHFFRQKFSQVTNPPIDSLREKHVMSLTTRLGNLGNILAEDESQCNLFQLESPVLTNGEFEALVNHMGSSSLVIDCCYTPNEGEDSLRAAIDRIKLEAQQAVRRGSVHLVLSDRSVDAEKIAIPMILATGAVHSFLHEQRLRTFVSLNITTGACLDVHNFAVLIGVGATTVNAYMAQDSLIDRHSRGLFPDHSLDQVISNFKEAINQGLLKIMSKMGISIISSYRGGYNFEAIGLSRTLVDEFFPGMASRISGIGLIGINKILQARHAKGYQASNVVVPLGGFYRYRKQGEHHSWEAGLMHTMQTAVANESFSTFKKYTEALNQQQPTAIRDLLGIKYDEAQPVSIDDVESITSIRKHFVTPGMSLGALSPEAHGTLNIAMNRIGAKSVSGEGGEVPERYTPNPNGDNANSAIKQVASGRFGVTAEYLNQCREIEIKMAQGAKPGEGGQLPGFKVTAEIARLRHATEGVMLISPPPHHDIYSIEDLAQLIYDLKQINPDAQVCVKLVARSGIGTIAAGVAKAKADVILISGHSGGTGASPQTSIKYVGLPWEMGLSEVHQVLSLNRLRHNIKLRTDGGLRTGRDIVIAAMLGAEEFGIGTASLVAMGCIMVRQCHSNTCPVGVCTQDSALRDKFTGTPEKVVNLFSFLAEEVREILSELGFKTLNEIIGRTDLLTQVSRGAEHLDDLDLNPLLAKADSGGLPTYCTRTERNPVPESLDALMIKDAHTLFEKGEKIQLEYTVKNTDRAVGTALSSKIVRKFGMSVLDPGHVKIRMRGSAGQSLAAWAVKGIHLEVRGDANDYVGKGLSGATVVVRPLLTSKLQSQKNTIIGNTVLYGATAGHLYAAGQAGERFAVRNSGATAVIEGCGTNGCEYMTGGTAVILGSVGDNFGAGMTGGMAFVYDREGFFQDRVNEESVVYQRIGSQHYEAKLKSFISDHVKETNSAFAQHLLDDWEDEVDMFWQIIPKEMLNKLERPLIDLEAVVA